MKHTQQPQSATGARSRGRSLLAPLLATLAAAFLVVACGGGGSADPGTGGTGSFSRGAITGFGSIIVNGVRFDDSSARVEDEDDDDSPSRNKDDLELGMVVTVSGSAGTGTGTATANVITFGSELKGPVASVNGSSATTTTSTTPSATVSGTQTLVILGQTVLIGTRTVFDPISLPGGFADIKVTDVLEVHGHLDPAANKLTATRINKEDGVPGHYKITGKVASLSNGSKTFKIGTQTTIDFGSVQPDKLRVALADGVNVKVRLNTTPKATDTWVATRIKAAAKKGVDVGRAEIEGVVTDYVSDAKFTVAGVEVDATNAEIRKDKGSLANGVRVEVKGAIVGGVLIASRVKVEDDDDEDNEIELHGNVSNLDTAAKTFDLRGLTVDYSGSVKFEGGSAAQLANGVRVEVKGSNAAGGIVKANKIEFEN